MVSLMSGSLRYSFVNRALMVMLRFQKYPDTCRRGLNVLLFCLSRCRGRRRRDCFKLLSPQIHIQIPETDLHTFLLRVVERI